MIKSVYRPEELKKRWLLNGFKNEYSQKKATQFKNGESTRIDIFFQEDIQMAIKHTNRCSISLVTKEIKATIR